MLIYASFFLVSMFTSIGNNGGFIRTQGDSVTNAVCT
jgi:hypothetical protein